MRRKIASPYPQLNRVTKRLASGRRVTYFYAWKGGPRIDADYGSAEFAAQYRDAHASRTHPAKVTGTLQDILGSYQRSRGKSGSGRGFLDLAERTRADYVKQISLIERKFGTLPLAALAQPKCRAVFLEWRDELAERSERQADYAFAVLTRVLSWAHHRRIISDNPCERAGRIYDGSRAEIVWSDDDEKAFLQVASPELARAFMLGAWTGQRQGDLLRLTWAAYDGARLRIRQSKTGRMLSIPVGAPLRQALEVPRLSLTILTNSRGQPWTADGFRSSWRKASARAGVDGPTFSDLRGTAVTRLAVAGASTPEIAAITGHRNAEVSAILDRHYLASDPALAESAMRKLETRTPSPNSPPNWAIGSGFRTEFS